MHGYINITIYYKHIMLLAVSWRELRLKLNRLFRQDVQLLLCAVATLPYFRDISLLFEPHEAVLLFLFGETEGKASCFL